MGQTVSEGFNAGADRTFQTVPFVVTHDDGFAFNPGDEITITYNGGLFLSPPDSFSVNCNYGVLPSGWVMFFAYYYFNPAGSTLPAQQWVWSPFSVTPENWTPFGITDNYQGHNGGSWSGGGSSPNPSTTGTVYAPDNGAFPSSQCDPSTGPLGVGGLVGAFATTDQLKRNDGVTPIPGTGIVVGEPFMIGMGGQFGVGQP
jgi:hypothetical protein